MTSAELKHDPATAALVLIDLQYGIVAMDVQPQPGSEIVARARQLAAAFRRVHAPVVLVTVGHAPDGKDALAPALDTPAPSGDASCDGRLWALIL
ncbi:Isochorismatase family protein YecD [compost metagenome]